ncbi:MAG: Rab family GTPase [Candidatus Hodarchaeota archaeon]
MMTLLTKICLCGDGWVGKTSLKSRYMGVSFNSNYLPTLGADFSAKQVKIEINKRISKELRFQIWDLAGQPTFNQTRALYYRHAVGSLLVFDITQPNSLYNLENWMFELSTRSGAPNISVIVLGNKVDLRNEIDGCITSEEANKFVIEHLSGKFINIDKNIAYLETSAKTGENVHFAFHELGRKILENTRQY